MDRADMAKKLDDDLENFIAGLKPKEYEDGWSEENWREEMEEHPMFRSKPIEEGQKLPPLIEAMQQLKYDPDENSPGELATSYKEDGNENFKRKKYRWAVHSYSMGLDAKCEDVELNVQLYTNRAAAHYHIGNFKKSLGDASEAIKIKNDHMKALNRGAMCCIELQQYEECIVWCAKGLKIDPQNESLLKLKQQAESKQKVMDRDQRKALVHAERKRKDDELLLQTIKARGIKLSGGTLELGDVETMHPAIASSRVHLDNDTLVWPVLFMYPEHGTTDYIREFHEDSTFSQQLKEMFNGDDIPQWDKSRQYIAENLQVYFNDVKSLVPVNKTSTLKQVVSHKRYQIHAGTPSFIVTVAGSEFDKSYRQKHKASS